MGEKVKRRVVGATRVSSKNQITVPVSVLRSIHLQAGDEVQVEAVGEGEFRVVRAIDPLEELLGSMSDVFAGFDLRQLRDEWDA